MRFLFFYLLLVGTPALAQLNADFSASVTQGCTPFNVSFKDNSSGSPTSWFWDFGDGQTSTVQNPAITYTTNGKFTVRLIVKNSSAQDYEEKINYITVLITPQVDFIVSGPDSGCVSLQTSFKDISELLGASVKSWSWSFGDGGTSAVQNSSYTYTTAGKFDVTLTLQTTQGCSSARTINDAVITGAKPLVNFSATPLKGCASTFRNFKNKTPGPNSAYMWDFGDGGISYDKDPIYHYQDTGFFTPKLIVSKNGCIDSALSIDNYIHVDGPAAKIDLNHTCDNPYAFTFKDVSVDENERLWDFGDKSQTSTDKSVTHTYSSPGVYIVKLSVTGTTCNDSVYDTLHIKTGTPVINLSPVKNIYCRNDSILFSVTDFDTIASKSFAWNFGDGFITTFRKKSDSIYYVYTINNSYKPFVYIKNSFGCIDSISFSGSIAVNGPMAEFQNSANGCTGMPVNFKDQSTPGDNAPITQWLWSYGDGSSSTDKGSVSYTYSFPVVYNAKLTVTDINGCTDTITHPIPIFISPVVNAGADTFACAGNSITLNPSGAESYVWQNNTDLSCTNCTNPVAKPTQSATYYVTGTSNGCSASDSINIKVQTKEFVTVQPNMYTVCVGDSVLLNATGTYSYIWSPSNNLNNSTIANPVAFPTVNTAYTVTGKDSNNCFSDAAVVNVAVNQNPTVKITDSIVQVLTGSTYRILGSVSNDVQNFEWIPPAGLSCYTCLEPITTVSNTVQYTLRGTNQFGCSDSDNITIIASCTGDAIFVPNTFSPNSDGMNDYFFPRSGATITIKSMSIFNRWGQLVFQKQNFPSNNYTSGWDGKYKNVLQNADVFIYIMEINCSGNRVFIKKGNVSLLR